MKKLLLKKSAVNFLPNLADEMCSKLREEMKSYVGRLMPLLYEKFGFRTPNFAEEEEYSICTGYLHKPIFVKQPFGATYLADEEEPCYKDVEIAEIIYSLDGDVLVATEEGDEWNSAELSTDELVHIASVLETTLNEKPKD